MQFPIHVLPSRTSASFSFLLGSRPLNQGACVGRKYSRVGFISFCTSTLLQVLFKARNYSWEETTQGNTVCTLEPEPAVARVRRSPSLRRSLGKVPNELASICVKYLPILRSPCITLNGHYTCM